MPLTVASEQRDSVGWVKEMLPLFSESCATAQSFFFLQFICSYYNYLQLLFIKYLVNK
jgi:hypothetical protein